VEGLHTDQKWADYVPVYFRDEVEIVAHDGLNVAHWNLDERRLARVDDSYVVNGRPLLLFHFSGFDFKGTLLSRHVSAESQASYLKEAVVDLASWYRAAVLANGHHEHIKIPYRYSEYDNGVAVPLIHRRLYRAAADRSSYSDPFCSSGPFYRSLKDAGLVDRSAAATSDYSAATLPSRDRLGRAAQVVMRGILRLGGPKRYAYLLKFFGRYARLENHAFLLDKRA
jgi:hypothetical protein